MNKYSFKCTPDKAGEDVAYVIGLMYAQWAVRRKIKYSYNCHPTEKSHFILEIDHDLSSEAGMIRYCWVPEYSENRGLRHTHFVYMLDHNAGGILAVKDTKISFVLAPYKKVVGSDGSEYRDKQVDKILNGKIPWLSL